MRARTVVAPDGGTWVIRRHWIARPPRIRWILHPRKLAKWATPDWLDLDDIRIVVAIFGLAIFIFFLIPALIFAVELMLFLVIASLVILVNSLFRRPWIVEAVRDQPERQVMRWRAVGLLRSRRVINEIAEAISHGQRHIETHQAELIDGEP